MPHFLDIGRHYCCAPLLVGLLLLLSQKFILLDTWHGIYGLGFGFGHCKGGRVDVAGCKM